MSVGFGFSVGDFLAALDLVGTVIDALHDASTSGAAYRELLTQLLTLQDALKRVSRLDLDDGERMEKIALRQAATQCQQTIEDFLAKIQKYQPHLKTGGTGSRIRDSWARIKWAVCKKDDVEKFRADLAGHTGAIEVLLLAVQIEATSLQSRRLDQGQKTLAGKIQDFSSQWLGKISAVASSVNQGVEQGKALVEATTKMMRMNLRIFQLVLDIHRIVLRVPAQVNRQQPVYMIDAFGKEAPFHLEFVRSAQALKAILKVNFSSTTSGARMIDQDHFVIEDEGTKQDIDLYKDWETCFFPGQRVSMSMTFRRTEISQETTCPSCGSKSDSKPDQEALCKSCGTVFRRVTEDLGEMLPPVDRHAWTKRLESVTYPSPQAQPSLKRKREDEETVGSREFRRIRLVRSDSRCKLYTLVANDWSDGGIGFVRVRRVEDEIWIEVESEDEPGRMLLVERVPSNSMITKQQETLLVWTSDADGFDRALSFHTPQACEACWRSVSQISSVTMPPPLPPPRLAPFEDPIDSDEGYGSMQLGPKGFRLDRIVPRHPQGSGFMGFHDSGLGTSLFNRD